MIRSGAIFSMVNSASERLSRNDRESHRGADALSQAFAARGVADGVIETERGHAGTPQLNDNRRQHPTRSLHTYQNFGFNPACLHSSLAVIRSMTRCLLIGTVFAPFV
jgi:hypothetical protein